MAAAEDVAMEYTYQPGEGSFTVAEMGLAARKTYEALVTLGATGIRATFDGGYDEGFAYFVAAHLAEGAVPVGEVVDRLIATTGETFGTTRAAVASQLDDLAADLATYLVGTGFGTGEYAL